VNVEGIDSVGDEQQRSAAADKAGKINFDDRGNAFFEWRDDLVCQDGAAAQCRRDQALETPGLSLVDEGMPAVSDAAPRDSGYGYNPYESGVLDRKAPPRKRDLRELSKWIEAKRKAGTLSK
jgi:hypothetical protein